MLMTVKEHASHFFVNLAGTVQTLTLSGLSWLGLGTVHFDWVHAEEVVKFWATAFLLLLNFLMVMNYLIINGVKFWKKWRQK